MARVERSFDHDVAFADERIGSISTGQLSTLSLSVVAQAEEYGDPGVIRILNALGHVGGHGG